MLGPDRHSRLLPIVAALALLSSCASTLPRMDHLPPGDERIMAELGAALEADEGIDATSIRVESREGVVVLSGVAASHDEVRRALRLAGRIDGVVQVVNRLRVLPPVTPGGGSGAAPTALE